MERVYTCRWARSSRRVNHDCRCAARLARNHSIVLIPRELAYLPDDIVANNISPGEWPATCGFLNKKSARPQGPHVRKAASISLNMAQISMSKLMVLAGVKAPWP